MIVIKFCKFRSGSQRQTYFLLSDFTLSSQDVCDSYSPEFAEFNDNHKSPTEIIKCV